MESFKIEPFLHNENSSHYINTKELAELLVARPHQLFQPHRILFNSIHLFLEGEGVFHIDFKTIKVRPRHILFVSPYQVSQFQHDLDYKSKVMIFTEDFLCKTSIQSQFYSETNLFNDPLILRILTSVKDLRRFLSCLNILKMNWPGPILKHKVSY